jgi:hypothetical protein
VTFQWSDEILLTVICGVFRLPGDLSVLPVTDSGCLETYRVQQAVFCDTEGKVQAHDDIIVGVALLAGREQVVSVGLDSKTQ